MSEIINKQKRDQLRRLHAAATKGKWSVWIGHASVHNNVTINQPHTLSQKAGSRVVCSCEEEEMEADRQGKRDAKFIAAALTAAALLAEGVVSEEELNG